MEHFNVNVIPLEGTTKRVSITKGVVDEKTRSLLDRNKIVFKKDTATPYEAMCNLNGTMDNVIIKRSKN